MNDRRSHAQAWLTKAGSDLTAARRLLAVSGLVGLEYGF